MASYKVAHITAEGEDVIIAIVRSEFGTQPNAEQHKIWEAMQMCAANNKLKGSVVLVWETGGGQMRYLAPPKFHTFLNKLTPDIIKANMNRTMEA